MKWSKFERIIFDRVLPVLIAVGVVLAMIALGAVLFQK